MAVIIQLRRGTAVEWTDANPVLEEGEIGAELDTGKFKMGNGVDAWIPLEYSSGIQGDPGTDGALWYDGEGAPDGATGVDGDYYLDIVNGDVYKKDGTWSVVASAKGPQGEQGETGEGLTFNWDETALGVRVGDEGSYNYVELKGVQGEQGDPGDPVGNFDGGGPDSVYTTLIIDGGVEL